MIQVGITERGDAALNNEWKPWVEKGLPAILITKDPVKLITENRGLFYGDKLTGNVILHATITGNGANKLFEKNVHHYYRTLNELQKLINDPAFDRKRLIIRQDPICVPDIILEGHGWAECLMDIPRFAKKNGLRYRMSFMDLYPHVRERMLKVAQDIDKEEDEMRKSTALAVNHEHPHAVERYKGIMKLQPFVHLNLESRLNFIDLIKTMAGLTDEEIEICGEPDMKCTGCVSKRDLDTFGITLDTDVETGLQRKACACLGVKRELLNNKHPCAHGCTYCYWKD